MLIQGNRTRRPYAPMTTEDVSYIYEKQKQHRGFRGLISISLQLGDQVKAALYRKQAEMIERDLRKNFDIIV